METKSREQRRADLQREIESEEGKIEKRQAQIRGHEGNVARLRELQAAIENEAPAQA